MMKLLVLTALCSFVACLPAERQKRKLNLYLFMKFLTHILLNFRGKTYKKKKQCHFTSQEHEEKKFVSNDEHEEKSPC